MSPGRLFDSPLVLVIIIVLALLLFGAPKLPGMARSLGQSMRIFKSEVKQMKDDPSSNKNTDQDTQDGEQPYEGRVVNSKDNHGYPSRHSNGSSGSTTEPPADRNA